ncbi:DUF6068 family protein [Hyalangium sp.]|uniref:DUF6068 family protein n=1 Tax=Hyalangium sp. TaxID=2028555 RepID=UPI002D3FE16B|nr:DUF6068 family protein [Hyalangium sp.]HYI03004.1 DUF6068 family protein [Hyalangium sp.]
MHLRSSVLSVLGLAALALLSGCASLQQPPPEDTTPPPPRTEPVTNPSQPSPSSGSTPWHHAQPSPSSGSTPWHQARVGDRVVYAFSANRVSHPDTSQVRIIGQLALEVAAVQAPWVWLKLSFADEAGRPRTGALLSKELIIPVSMEASRPLEWVREGTESTEELSAGGRTWQAKRSIRDNRPSDGPLENRLYAAKPGPLYLMGGLLSASNTLSGFGASGSEQLTLVEFQQGREGSTATAPPTLQYPLGPGTWSDSSTNLGSGPERFRTCISAERGYVLTATGPAPAAGGAPCPSFAEAELVPLEEVLLTFVPWLASMVHSPQVRGTPSRRGTLSLKNRRMDALIFEMPETSEGVRQIRYEIYAAEPWEPALDGLHYLARFSPLAEGVDRVEAKDPRKPTFLKKLVDWGVWAGGEK